MVLPRAIKPMLARNGGEPFDGAGYGFEVKWDGIRCLIVADGATRLQNRHLRNVTGQFPELDFPALPPGTVIDGEIVVLKAGVPSFYALQRRSQLQSTGKIGLAATTTPATFMAFDLLYLQGRPTTIRTSRHVGGTAREQRPRAPYADRSDRRTGHGVS